MIDVKSVEDKSNGKGPWKVVKYINDKGEERTTNVFDKAIIAKLAGIGKYDAKFVKKGNYWNLIELELLSGVATKTQEVAAAPAAVVPQVNARVNMAVSAMDAGSKVVAAMVQSGVFQDVDPDSIYSAMRVAIREAFALGKELVSGTSAPAAKIVEDETEGA